MGLDSVELLMEWESYFGIEISDAVAGKIATVQDAVDAISAIMQVSGNSMALRNAIFSRL